MVYMGSKAKYADSIVPILQKVIDDNGITTYIECFVGGANIIDKIKCENRYGFDNSDTLIALLKQAQEDFSKIPEDGTREMWDEGKAYVKDGIQPTTMSLADIGAI
jgi:DNA adenine methylase